MSREIKFRAWNGHYMAMFAIYNPQTKHLLPVTIPHTAGEWVLMQFTGLKDKNGVEIYEGDILKGDVGDILEVKFGRLSLDKSGDCVCTYPAFYCKNYGSLGIAPQNECQEIGGWMKVIGNIYQNPELLIKEEEKK